MWHPNRLQWAIIWASALLLILAWPPGTGRSLGMKAVNWVVDPSDSLPTFPPPLPMGMGDDGDAVAAHDAAETDYYHARNSSSLTLWRMTIKEARDPLNPQTQRQLLVAVAVLAALVVWRLARID